MQTTNWLAPTVSVVVPTHNRPALVAQAVRSIVGQSFDGTIEVIVVFDKSEPHVIEVELPPGRTLRRLRNDARTPGLAGARNTGILAAFGDFVAFCDDDDEWCPDKLRRQLARLEAFGADAVCATGIRVVSDGHSRVRRGPDRVIGFEDLLRDRIMELHPSTLLFARQTLLEQIGLVDEAVPGSYGEDYELLLRASRVRPIVNVPEPLVNVAFNSGSFYASRWRVIIAGLSYLIDRYPEFNESPAGKARILGQIAFAHAALGERRAALRLVRETGRLNPREKRAYAAVLVVLGLPSDTVAGLARTRARGI